MPRPARAAGAAHAGTGVDVSRGPSVGCGETPDAGMRMVRRGMRLDLQGACSAESWALGRHGGAGSSAGPGGTAASVRPCRAGKTQPDLSLPRCADFDAELSHNAPQIRRTLLSLLARPDKVDLQGVGVTRQDGTLHCQPDK
jgi:hypothetical protein